MRVVLSIQMCLSMASSQWRVIKASIPDLGKMLKPFEKNMGFYLTKVKASFSSSTQTWDYKPVFDKEVQTIGGWGSMIKVVGTVSTEDDVYRYLNDGTSVRYATMTPNFKAKTKPGRISAGAGAGRVSYVLRSRPRPGIKARKFDEQIAKARQKDLESFFAKAVTQAITASGHKI